MFCPAQSRRAGGGWAGRGRRRQAQFHLLLGFSTLPPLLFGAGIILCCRVGGRLVRHLAAFLVYSLDAKWHPPS